MEATNFLNIRMNALMLNTSDACTSSLGRRRRLFKDDVEEHNFVASKEVDGDANDKDKTQDE